MLGYDRGSVGRRMSPEFVRLRTAATAADALVAVRRTGSDAESVYLLPITDDDRTLLGVVTLADLATAAPSTPVGDLYSDHPVVEADSSAEEAARLCSSIAVLRWWWSIPSNG